MRLTRHEVMQHERMGRVEILSSFRDKKKRGRDSRRKGEQALRWIRRSRRLGFSFLLYKFLNIQFNYNTIALFGLSSSSLVGWFTSPTIGLCARLWILDLVWFGLFFGFGF